MIKIKRIILLLLTFAVCFAFVSCDSSERLMNKYAPQSENANEPENSSDIENSDGNSNVSNFLDKLLNPNEPEVVETDVPAELVGDFVGEWQIYIAQYDTVGRVNTANLCRMAIGSDASVTVDGSPARMYYNSQNQLVYIDLSAVDYGAVPLQRVEVDGYPGLQFVNTDGSAFIGQSDEDMAAYFTVYSTNDDRTASVRNSIIGEWSNLNGETRTFSSDGYIYTDGSSAEAWEVACLGPYNFIKIGGGVPSLFEDNVYYLDGYYNLSSPKVTQITPDNWRNYFSENLADNFDVITKTLTDEWGDPYTEEVLKLKTSKNYVEKSYLVIEYESFYEGGSPYINTINVSVTGETDIPFKYGDKCRITRMRGLLIEE